MTLRLTNDTAWRTLDVRRIILAGMRAHAERPGATVIVTARLVYSHEKHDAVRNPGTLDLRLPRRVSDVGVANVWAPHEIDDDLSRRVARDFAAHVDEWLFWHRAARFPRERGTTPAWYEPSMRLHADPPKPPKPPAPKPSTADLLERELARVLAGLHKAVERRKRAARLEAKWHDRLKLLERKIKRAEQGPRVGGEDERT